MRIAGLTTVLAGALVACAGTSYVHAQQAGCTGTTVDSFGQAEGVQYRYFMLELKKAIKEDDRKRIADTMVNYPLDWNRKDGTVQIKSRGEFLKNYDEIFTAELKGKIEHQDVKCLPGNDEGANVGDGELRFFKFARNNAFQITSISQPGMKKSEKLPWE